MVATGADALRRIEPGRTQVVANTHETITGEFTRNPDLVQPTDALVEVLEDAAGAGRCDLLSATDLADRLTGDAIGANLFMLGFAFQRGLVPLSEAAFLRAIELNGVAVAANKATFAWGRFAAADPKATRTAAGLDNATPDHARTLDESVRIREAELVEYQDAACARRYTDFVRQVAAAEAERVPGRTELAQEVSNSLYRLMAYKDEYEVARLYSLPSYRGQLADTFEGSYRLKLHLAPPLLARRDPATGHFRKRAFGPWIFSAFRLLARGKVLRGTPLDPFGWTEERRGERALVDSYRATVEQVLTKLSPGNHASAVRIAAGGSAIRGFGHVKAASLERAAAEQARMLKEFSAAAPAVPQLVAAE